MNFVALAAGFAGMAGEPPTWATPIPAASEKVKPAMARANAFKPKPAIQNSACEELHILRYPHELASSSSFTYTSANAHLAGISRAAHRCAVPVFCQPRRHADGAGLLVHLVDGSDRVCVS